MGAIIGFVFGALFGFIAGCMTTVTIILWDRFKNFKGDDAS